MTPDGDLKLSNLVEDIVEILSVQLGPKEGAPVDCTKSVRGHREPAR